MTNAHVTESLLSLLLSEEQLQECKDVPVQYKQAVFAEYLEPFSMYQNLVERPLKAVYDSALSELSRYRKIELLSEVNFRKLDLSESPHLALLADAAKHTAHYPSIMGLAAHERSDWGGTGSSPAAHLLLASIDSFLQHDLMRYTMDTVLLARIFSAVSMLKDTVYIESVASPNTNQVYLEAWDGSFSLLKRMQEMTRYA